MLASVFSFGDGHVVAMGPDAIDPRYCELYEKSACGQGCDFAHSLDDPYETPICWEVEMVPMLNSINELNLIKFYNCGPYQAWWCSGAYVEVLGECGNILYTANLPQAANKNNTLAYGTWQFNMP